MGLINYIDIDWPQLLKPIPGAKVNYFNRVRIRREVIPIIFVPGIMGSRLKNKATNKKVWDPDHSLFMLSNFGRNTPAGRKKLVIGKEFNPDYLAVNEKDEIHNRKFLRRHDPGRVDRGWGGVAWSSYGSFIIRMQQYDWTKPVNEKLQGDERFKELAGHCFEFPVHAFGYNWTDTNDNSGKKLAGKIEEIIKHYKSKKRLCKYVILVSHSMGGLVCRSACVLHKADKNVLGIVHGVQPAVGAAAAYWRMKAGWERRGILQNMMAWVLGPNGQAVTCILGNAPGGLELLPNKHYKTNEGKTAWLKVPLKGGLSMLLPQADSYKEIYKVKDNLFWRLVNPDWLDPMEILISPEILRKKSKAAWGKYIRCLNTARDFHDDLQMKCYENGTYQFYFSGLDTIDKVAFKRERFSMANVPHAFYALGMAPVVYETVEPSYESTASGKCVMYVDGTDRNILNPLPEPAVTYVLSMSPIEEYKNNGGGDGTVPDSSGCSLKEKCLHTRKFDKVEHSKVYGERYVMDYVIKCIRNLALKRIRESEVASAR